MGQELTRGPSAPRLIVLPLRGESWGRDCGPFPLGKAIPPQIWSWPEPLRPASAFISLSPNFLLSFCSEAGFCLNNNSLDLSIDFKKHLPIHDLEKASEAPRT